MLSKPMMGLLDGFTHRNVCIGGMLQYYVLAVGRSPPDKRQPYLMFIKVIENNCYLKIH